MAPIIGKKLDKITCSLCNEFSSTRLTIFEKHLIGVHETTSQNLWNKLHNGPILCACGCNQQTKWVGWKTGYSTVIVGHNGNLVNVYGKEKAKEISDKRKAKLKGQVSWAKGLTKENDQRILNRSISTGIGIHKAFKEGKIKIWNKGLTKESDQRLEKFAKVQKQRFIDGKIIPWSKGLTKENDQRILDMSNKVSLTMKQENIRNRLDDLKRLNNEEIQRRIESTGILKIVDCANLYVNDVQQVIRVECKKCGAQFIDSLRKLQKGRCFNCSPGGSQAQTEIENWIKSLGFNVIRNDKKKLNGKELDIYIPEKNLGIEYNGLYWHCVLQKSELYHENKTNICKSLSVSLIHVFEDEWRDKKEIIKSMISSRLNMSSTKVYARNCNIIELSSKQRQEFFSINHLDGDVKSHKAWGLLDKNTKEIIYAISLRKPFHSSKGNVYEIARCCPKLNHNVPGGLSKLVKVACVYSKINYKTGLLTYVDTRHGGTGKGYELAGFKLKSKTSPRFWWTNFDNRFNRFKYKANKSNNLTEAQVAEQNEVTKIWGCSNIIYELLF